MYDRKYSTDLHPGPSLDWTCSCFSSFCFILSRPKRYLLDLELESPEGTKIAGPDAPGSWVQWTCSYRCKLLVRCCDSKWWTWLGIVQVIRYCWQQYFSGDQLWCQPLHSCVYKSTLFASLRFLVLDGHSGSLCLDSGYLLRFQIFANNAHCEHCADRWVRLWPFDGALARKPADPRLKVCKVSFLASKVVFCLYLSTSLPQPCSGNASAQSLGYQKRLFRRSYWHFFENAEVRNLSKGLPLCLIMFHEFRHRPNNNIFGRLYIWLNQKQTLWITTRLAVLLWSFVSKAE